MSELLKPYTRCGRRCTNPNFMGSLSVSAGDEERLEREERWDILQWVDAGDLWLHPETGEEKQRCPFVRKDRNQPTYKCRIYDTHPHVCRQYQQRIDHMRSVDCEMLEPGDTDEDVRRFMAEENEDHGR